MTKEAAPVCGALTRKGSLCQNTLVTGCGRCPVHASQLRMAQAAGKPAPHSMKKSASKRLSSSSSIQDGLSRHFDPAVLQTPDHTGTRTILHNGYHDAGPSVRTDSNSVLTPSHQFDAVNSVFHTPVQTTFQSAFGTKGEVEIHEMFPQHKSHCSPVTPDGVPDTTTKLDFFSAGENEVPDQEQQYSNDAVLQGHVDVNSTLAHIDYADLGDISESKGTVTEAIAFSSGLI